MEWKPDVAWNAVITPGSTHTDTIATTIQLKDFAGNNLTVPAAVKVYLASDSVGLDFNTTSLTTDMTASVGDIAILTTSKSYLLVSTSAGAITISMGYTTGAKDFYLVIILPNGKRVVSSKIEFTN